MDEQQYEQAVDQAFSQAQSGDYLAAEQTCRAILEQLQPAAPERGAVLSYLGNALFMQKRYNESFETYNQSLEWISDEPELWYNRAVVANYLSLIGQALTDFEKAYALTFDPARKKLIKKELDATRRVVKQELRGYGPKATVAELTLAQALFREAVAQTILRNWTEAEQRLRAVLAISDRLAPPHINLGVVLLNQLRLDEAEQAFTRALEIAPDSQLARVNLAHVAETRRTGQLPENIIFDNPLDDSIANPKIDFD